jgi:hypothetical protein
MWHEVFVGNLLDGRLMGGGLGMLEPQLSRRRCKIITVGHISVGEGVDS